MLTLQHYGAPVAQEANILVFMIVFINNLHGYHELFKRIFGWGGGGGVDPMPIYCLMF